MIKKSSIKIFTPLFFIVVLPRLITSYTLDLQSSSYFHIISLFLFYLGITIYIFYYHLSSELIVDLNEYSIPKKRHKYIKYFGVCIGIFALFYLTFPFLFGLKTLYKTGFSTKDGLISYTYTSRVSGSILGRTKIILNNEGGSYTYTYGSFQINEGDHVRIKYIPIINEIVDIEFLNKSPQDDKLSN